MGTKNKQRRREKAKQRVDNARRRASRMPSGDRWHDNARSNGGTTARVREALWTISGLRRSGDARTAMIELECADFGVVAREAEAQLAWLVGHLWHAGWQPAELARHARRHDPRVGLIVAGAVAADHVRRDRATLHPHWAAQADAIAAGAKSEGWLLDVIESAGMRRGMRLLFVIKAIGVCASVGTLPTILPPPASDPTMWDRVDDFDNSVLAKVRALLAQAESTTFEAEAEVFTAKAQELMARHALDSALVWSRLERRSRPTTIRIPIDDPYAEQKSLLLQFVAEHAQCKAVMHMSYGLQSVIGFGSDVAATDLLFTSLLVQSQQAMQAEAATAPPRSRVRSRSFRASFLHAYAQRICQRLAEINRSVREAVEVEQAAEHRTIGSSLLPVLAARRDAIDEEVEAMFGTLVAAPVQRGWDALGWARGGLAADRAEFNPSVAENGSSPRKRQPPTTTAEPTTLF